MVELLVSGTVVIFLDQTVKRAVALHASPDVFRCGSVLTIRNVASRRSFYANTLARVVLVAVWIAALVSAVILTSIAEPPRQTATGIALGSALGGAGGNLLDILRDRSVRDFIDLGWWPVFNIADVAIVAGLALALLAR